MPPALRILQMGKFFPPDRGGIETVTRNISEMLTPLAIRADVLCLGLEAEGDLDVGSYSVRRIRPQLVLGGNKALSTRYITDVRAASARYDVGLLHMPNPLAALAALIGWRKPLVLLWHADFSIAPLRAVGDRLDEWLIRRADAVIAPTCVHLDSSRLADRMRSKSTVIPYPFTPGPAASEAPSDLSRRVARWADGRRVVLAVGRLVPYKGFDVLVDAAAKSAGNVAWVIVGDGPLQPDLTARVARLGLGDRVLLTGGVSPDDMQRLIALADFGCLPSVTAQEMYGMTQVEMMAAGKPMISTDIPRSGVPCVNLHDTTGLIVPPRDATALANAATHLANDRALHARFSTGAAETFAAGHVSSQAARRYAELLHRVAGKAQQAI